MWLRTNIRYERVAVEGISLWLGSHLPDPEPLLCFLFSVSPSLSLSFFLPLSSCLYRGKGTGGLSLSTCCGYKVFHKDSVWIRVSHCVNTAQPLVFCFLKAHAVCRPGYGKVRSLWRSDGYCAARRLSKMAASIVALNQKMQRYICALGWHNRGTVKGNCKRMAERDKSFKSACHQYTDPKSRKQVRVCDVRYSL